MLVAMEIEGGISSLGFAGNSDHGHHINVFEQSTFENDTLRLLNFGWTFSC
jgi:hypothetical protein